MTKTLLSRPNRLLMPGRRDVLVGGAAAGAGLAMPRYSWAQDDNAQACAQLAQILREVRQQAEDATRWAITDGPRAIATLERRIAKAEKDLAEAQAKEGALERALFVDVISTVGGAGFVVIAFAGAPLTPGLFLAGLGFSTATMFAQLVTNDSPPGPVGLVSATGWPGRMLDALGESFGGQTAVASRNLGTAFQMAGRVLGVVTTGLSAIETVDTWGREADVQDEVERLQQLLADLRQDLEQYKKRSALAEMRRLSARAVLGDLEAMMAAGNCDLNAPPPRNTGDSGLSIPIGGDDSTIGPAPGSESGQNSVPTIGPSTGSTTTPGESTTPERVKRFKLIQN